MVFQVMTPAEALRHFSIALGMGAALGVLYGFLRPVAGRCRWFADLVFMVAFFRVWLELGFGICRGDLRLGCSAGLPCGIFLWDKTLGRFLRPVFDCFGDGSGASYGFFSLLGKYFLKKSEKL